MHFNTKASQNQMKHLLLDADLTIFLHFISLLCLTQCSNGFKISSIEVIGMFRVLYKYSVIMFWPKKKQKQALPRTITALLCPNFLHLDYHKSSISCLLLATRITYITLITLYLRFLVYRSNS